MGAKDGCGGRGEESGRRMNYSLGYGKGAAGLSFELGTITRDQKIFEFSAADATACMDAVVRTLMREQPEFFDGLITLDWSEVEAVANADGTIAICDKNNHDTVRLLLPEALTLQTLRDTYTQLAQRASANSDAIRQLQETIDGVADALDAI